MLNKTFFTFTPTFTTAKHTTHPLKKRHDVKKYYSFLGAFRIFSGLFRNVLPDQTCVRNDCISELFTQVNSHSLVCFPH